MVRGPNSNFGPKPWVINNIFFLNHETYPEEGALPTYRLHGQIVIGELSYYLESSELGTLEWWISGLMLDPLIS